MTEFKKTNKMTCEEAQLLMVPIWAKMPGIDNNKKMAFNVHVIVCPQCSKEYEETKKLMPLVKENWGSISTKTRQLVEQAGLDVLDQKQTSNTKPATVEKCVKGLYRHYPELAESAEKPYRLRFLHRMGTIAACLIIGISLWIAFFDKPKPQIPPEKPASGQFVSANIPTVKIEEISNTGNLIIPSGQEIASTNQLKTLLINDKHRLIMNENTILSIKPLSENERIGCVVNLVSGQIYAQVEHVGNPFVVETAHGKAVITGTTFDVKATDNSTTLIVAEGTVEFASEISSVDVLAGYKSEIIDKTAPTTPSICDTVKLTAWATGYELKTTLSKIESLAKQDTSDLFDFSDILTVSFSGTSDLAELNYQKWVEQKREWFEREFPQIFQLKEALANEQIKVDYPKLLVTSGSLWQFVYQESLIKKIPVITFESLLKAGSQYGYDEQWLLENIPSSKALMAKPEGILTGQNTFLRWSEQFKQMKNSQQPDSDVLLCSLLASVYLANTRTLAWLYITNENTILSAENRTEILSLLQNEVNTAEKLKEYIIRLFAVSEKLPCEESNVLIDKVIDNLSEIMEIEKAVQEFQNEGR